ncbi:ABC transporter ATP-binding protein, partial [Streptomyces niveus]
MSMESTAWTQLHNVMNARSERRPFARATLRKIAGFARPHRRRIIQFVLLGVAPPRRAGATPRQAGRREKPMWGGGDARGGGRGAQRLGLLGQA